MCTHVTGVRINSLLSSRHLWGTDRQIRAVHYVARKPNLAPKGSCAWLILALWPAVEIRSLRTGYIPIYLHRPVWSRYPPNIC